MLNAGFSEKQCAAIMREILSGGEGDEDGGGGGGGGGGESGGDAAARARAVMLAGEVVKGLVDIVGVYGVLEEDLHQALAQQVTRYLTLLLDHLI